MDHIFLFFNLGGGEIFIILLIVLLLFGSKKIPELARGLGKGIRYFKEATSDVQDEIKDSVKDTEFEADPNKDKS
ncbi:MAG: twin-arginine translocase TatA/TatE family subunit [Flavobacteriales bacterium]|nr:twin-arginine translocase TatA/TatE family subunit [Flavobacteriales bacterium]MBL4733894.1 twin-arginine translocase TatA/TatE family subunit [Flavobacteriales bacterium]